MKKSTSLIIQAISLLAVVVMTIVCLVADRYTAAGINTVAALIIIVGMIHTSRL